MLEIMNNFLLYTFYLKNVKTGKVIKVKSVSYSIYLDREISLHTTHRQAKRIKGFFTEYCEVKILCFDIHVSLT